VYILAWAVFLATAFYAWPVTVKISVFVHTDARLTVEPRILFFSYPFTVKVCFQPFSVSFEGGKKGKKFSSKKEKHKQLALRDILKAAKEALSRAKLEKTHLFIRIGFAEDAAATALIAALLRTLAAAGLPGWYGLFLHVFSPAEYRIMPDYRQSIIYIDASCIVRMHLGHFIRVGTYLLKARKRVDEHGGKSPDRIPDAHNA